jgi:hypothetical protein
VPKSRMPLAVMFALALLAGGASHAVAVPALTLSNTTGLTLGNPPFTLGWQFEVDSAFWVRGLGVFDDSLDGLTDSHAVGLWNSSGTLLTSTTVSSGTANPLVNQFRFAPVTPFTIAPGIYRVGALFLSGNDGLIFPGGATGVATVPGLTFVQNAFTFGSSLSDPTATVDGQPAYFGANLDVEPVPEPATLLLLGGGLAGIALKRKRRA